jgi:hypothetical protein
MECVTPCTNGNLIEYVRFNIEGCIFQPTKGKDFGIISHYSKVQPKIPTSNKWNEGKTSTCSKVYSYILTSQQSTNRRASSAVVKFRPHSQLFSKSFQCTKHSEDCVILVPATRERLNGQRIICMVIELELDAHTDVCEEAESERKN